MTYGEFYLFRMLHQLSQLPADVIKLIVRHVDLRGRLQGKLAFKRRRALPRTLFPRVDAFTIEDWQYFDYIRDHMPDWSPRKHKGGYRQPIGRLRFEGPGF